MASSHSSPRVNDLNLRHTHTHTHPQPHLLPHSQTYPPPKPEQPPPSKRRRANSANPSVSSTAPPTTSPPSTHWQPDLKSPPYSADRTFDTFPPRTTSPDRASRVSNTSSQPVGGPQLRKKPKSNSIKNNNLLRAATIAIIQSPSLPTLPTIAQPQSDSTQNFGNNTGNAGPYLSRANSSSSQHLSPNQKRPPASHSSYGVETICGPPPSYSTQRTLSQERIRKLDRNSTGAQPQPSTSNQAQALALDDTPEPPVHQKESVPMLIHSSPDSTDTYDIPTPTETDTVAGVRIRGEQRTSMEEEGKVSSSDERKSEDLFLNIARVDAARPPPPQNEKRRSRISIPFLPSNRQSHVVKSSSVQPVFESSPIVSARSEMPQYHSKRASLGGNVSSTYSQRGHLHDLGRFREQSADLSSDNERNENTGHKGGLRRASTTNTEYTRLAHRSSAGLRHQRLISESVQAENQKTGEQITTESTISTTAPSTVWDELDDLKSRIRKLEITGKLPSSSAAAMASTERPRTATTAATTMSTSPKYKQSESNLQSTIEDAPLSVHPLLHESLNNARVVLSHDVYQKLQATAQDALQLAAMMSTDGAGDKNYAGTSGNERQIKRRAESMCRGLTELAIALAAEAKPTQSNARPASREYSLPPNSMLRGRRYSNDPADRSLVSPRVQSRLDNRRTSLHLGRTDAGNSSPERGVYQSPGPTPLSADVRINRSTLLRKRGQNSFDGSNEHFDASPSIRPGSRAMTDLGAYRNVSRDYVQSPREYTSQHPLPTQQEQEAALMSANTTLPHSVSSNFTSRRKYVSPGSVVGAQDNSPMTPRETWGRISTVPMDTQSPDVISEAGAPSKVSSTRRSLGFAGRIGSSVGSRLRAARAEKSSRENLDMPHDRDMMPLVYHHNTPARNSSMYPADHA